jgi:very-short-patch-repair endonuclease
LLRFKADGLYREQRLVVELDSRRWHEGPLAQDGDRERTAELEAHGYRIMRITGRDLKRHRGRTEERLRPALAQSSSATRPAGTAPSRTTDQAPVSS